MDAYNYVFASYFILSYTGGVFMIAIYCRQSIDKKDSISIEAQIDACKRLVHDDDYIVYYDKGFTGTNINRPEFSKLMMDIEDSKISKVICYKVDRISRSLQDFVGIYAKFEKHNVEFVSCNEQFDTSTAMGKATLQIIMVFAELERNMIQKRVKDNFYERAKKGLFLAGVAPYGFKKVPIQIDGINTHMLEVDNDYPEKIELVRKMYEDYILEKSLGSVAKKLNEAGHKTNRNNCFTSIAVNRILRNPVYVRADADVYEYLKKKGATMNEPIESYIGVYGLTIYGTRKNKTTGKFINLEGDCVQMNKHEGIIDSSLWLAVQHELDKNKQITNSGKGKNTWLTGLTKCGFCGMHISVVSGQRNGKRYLNCGGRKANFCFERTVTLTFDDIESVVEQCLIEHIRKYEFERIQKEKTNIAKINELKIRKVKIQEEISNLLNKVSMANDILFEYINDRIKQLDYEKTEIERILLDEGERLKNRADPEFIRKALNDWKSMSFDEKKTIAGIFIDKVVIYNRDIDISFK